MTVMMEKSHPGSHHPNLVTKDNPKVIFDNIVGQAYFGAKPASMYILSRARGTTWKHMMWVIVI